MGAADGLPRRRDTVTLLGHSNDLQTVVDELPDPFAISDVKVSESTAGVDTVLTDRQREAISVAWDLGYYEQPRRATVQDVATELDAAMGTTSELLRRAERELVRAALTSSQLHPVN